MTVRRLDRLIDLRRREETLRRQELGIAVRAENEARAAVDQAERVLAAEQGKFRDVVDSGELSAALLKRFTAELLDLERALEAQRQTLAEAVRARDVEQSEYELARRKKRSLERLEEKRKAAEEREARRREQKDADGVALRRHQDGTSRWPKDSEEVSP